MDSLLKCNKFNFFVDEIYLETRKFNKDLNERQGGNLFGALLIPDINSTYFPPYHLRRILFPANFLSSDFYNNYRKKNQDLEPMDDLQFSNSIAEGRYYSIPTNLFFNGKLPTILPSSFQDLLKEYNFVSPYQDKLSKRINSDGLALLEENKKENDRRESILIYCFNVGQGDSLLLIFPNDNVYLIDTNIYSDKSLNQYIYIIQRILKMNGLPERKIKALLITHKHLDHIRGGKNLINSGKFAFEHFLINFDYKHSTKVVDSLMKAAEKNIINHININQQGFFNEGKVKVSVLNPKENTCNNSVCCDLNDTSIMLHLEFGNSNVLLSGDAGYSVTNNVISGTTGNCFMKISHHGSRTGTDQTLISNLRPSHAFISAGNHKGFKHPHSEPINILNSYNVDYDISKEVGSMVYEVTEKSINKLPFNFK